LGVSGQPRSSLLPNRPRRPVQAALYVLLVESQTKVEDLRVVAVVVPDCRPAGEALSPPPPDDPLPTMVSRYAHSGQRFNLGTLPYQHTHRRQRRYGCCGRSPSDTFCFLKSIVANHTSQGCSLATLPKLSANRISTVGCYYQGSEGYCRRRYLVKPKLYNTQQ
jgi:hypothetical protein